MPTLPERSLRVGDDYTVWGASFSLRSETRRDEVTEGTISVVGTIIRTNLPDAPLCAVHRTGKADPDNCFAAIPTFWLGDTRDAAEGDSIRVMGWASNYAQIHDAMLQYDAAKAPEPYLDSFWGVEVPNPLPAAGARVRVTGSYSKTFNMAVSGSVDDPVMGIMTATKVEVLEPAPELATLPGLKRKPR